MAWQVGLTIVALSRRTATSPWSATRSSQRSGQSLGFFYAMFVRELVDVRSGHWLVPLGYGLVIFIPIYTFLGGPGIVSGRLPRTRTRPCSCPISGPEQSFLAPWSMRICSTRLYHLVRARSRTTSSIERNRLTYLIIGVPVVILGSAMNYIPQFRAYPIDMMANVLNAASDRVGHRSVSPARHPARAAARACVTTITTVIVSMIYFLLVSLSRCRSCISSRATRSSCCRSCLAAVAAVAVQPLRDAAAGARRQALLPRQVRRCADAPARKPELGRRARHRAVDRDDPHRNQRNDADRAGRVLSQRRDSAAYRRGRQPRAWTRTRTGGCGLTTRSITHLSARPQVFVAQNLDRLPLARAFRLEEREQWEQLRAGAARAGDGEGQPGWTAGRRAESCRMWTTRHGRSPRADDPGQPDGRSRLKTPACTPRSNTSLPNGSAPKPARWSLCTRRKCCSGKSTTG